MRIVTSGNQLRKGQVDCAEQPHANAVKLWLLKQEINVDSEARRRSLRANDSIDSGLLWMFEGDRGERALPGGRGAPLKGGPTPGAQHPQTPREKRSCPIRYTIYLWVDSTKRDQIRAGDVCAWKPPGSRLEATWKPPGSRLEIQHRECPAPRPTPPGGGGSVAAPPAAGG